jgi:hypothetical protein
MSFSREERARHGEAGFTLVEALVAILVLVVGLMGIANLFALAASSNSVANHGTAAVAEATETMERLKTIPFMQLLACCSRQPQNPPVCVVPGGCLDNPLPFPAVLPGNQDPDLLPTWRDPASTDVPDPRSGQPFMYNRIRDVPGVGPIRTTWRIWDLSTAGGPPTLHITVRSESTSPMRGRRSRAEFTMFRTCTTAGCP